MYSYISSTLSGISTVRSFEKQALFSKKFYECVDYATESRVTFLMCSRWFSQRIDFAALIFTICSIFAPIIALEFTDIDEGLVGVSLTYVLSLGSIFQWFIRQSAEVENLMTSVQRVYEYADLENEPDDGQTKELNNNWPSTGCISADHVTYSYHGSLPPVVDGLSFHIENYDKIGIVGRTGAGKSTLISMLLRLGENKGLIQIDGYDINDLTLRHLRKNISIIPQDPVLFSATLRKNLDPFEQYEDADIWQSLEKVQMKESISSYPDCLETKITESGSNLSVGERQLLCLARAILEKNKILMIDEATANVDQGTDELIQQTIREAFKECTVLTIAHRLNTIIDYDKLMVMDKGVLVEFDSPKELLKNQDGYFYALVEEVDHREAERLKTIAARRRQSVALHLVQEELEEEAKDELKDELKDKDEEEEEAKAKAKEEEEAE